MKRMSIALLVTALFLLAALPAGTAYAQTLYVPDNFATIQAALDAADDLYTIIVRDGVYTGPGNRDLDFNGKALALRSENGPENCIIDCEGSYVNEGRGFYFHSGETTASVVNGFTITNGYTVGDGAGICCIGSSPTITNCIISDNECTLGTGGVHLVDSSATITDCIIRNNQMVIYPGYDSGAGGIYCTGASSVIISNCIITGNRFLENNDGHIGGGGIACYRSASLTVLDCTISGNSTDMDGGGICAYYNATLVISNCTVSDNTAQKGFGGGIYAEFGSSVSLSGCSITNNTARVGGGAFFAGLSATITDCTVKGNSTELGGSMGGGLFFNYSPALIERCIVIGNSARGHGGGLCCYGDASCTVINSIIAGNSTDSNGGGMWCNEESSVTVANSTVADNRSSGDGGGIYCTGATTNFKNCIFWGNSAFASTQIALFNTLTSDDEQIFSSATIDYCDIMGGREGVHLEAGGTLKWGEGNIDADPLFAKSGYWYNNEWLDGDYHLTHNSPCKDNATDAEVDSDIDGDARPSGLGFDMGADEFIFVPNNCPALSSAVMSPDPDNTTTTYRFTVQYYDEDGDLPTTSNVVIDDIPHAMTLLSGSPADGVYYYDTRLSAGSRNYHFSFYDGASCLARLPLAGDFATPEIIGVTRHVPEDFSTIQAALDDCMSGDTIIVGDGVYTGPGNKDLDFKGKAIKLRSHNGAESCIIDCEGDGNGFSFYSRETGDTVVDGFTVVNACSTGILPYTVAGGIFCFNGSSPTIVNCIIANTSSPNDVGGTGISISDFSSPTIINCIISTNAGSGIFSGDYSSPIIRDCIITDNARGGLVGGLLEVVNCVITGNFDSGIYIGADGATISGCSISDNSATYGGGIYIGLYVRQINITDCMITSNDAVRGGGIYSGRDSSSTHRESIIANTIISNNSADSGGGIYLWHSDDPFTLTNCTIAENSLDGITCEHNSSLPVTNSIFYGNGPKDISLLDSSTLNLSFSDVYGGMSCVYVEEGSALELGEGNIVADPLFVSGPLGDFYLSQRASGQYATSRCVDAGSDSAAALWLDVYTTRTDEKGDIGTVDMGYHYPNADTTKLAHARLLSPPNESIISNMPTLTWKTNGGANNVFVVDIAVSLRGPMYTSPGIQGESFWTMPQQSWDRIPSGSFVYWRVRGADLDATPLSIIYSDEIWWFYKP